jgi:uncharacterized protein (TIGR02118 family)
MAKLIALFKHPEDAAAFVRFYFSTHVPLANTLPCLRKYDVSNGGVNTPAGPSAYHLAATLYFDSVASIQAAFASPEGQKAAADLGNFADGGVELLVFDTKEV